MKREELEKNLGEMVEITLFDGEIIKGCLRKTHKEMFKNDPNLYLPQKRYFLTDSKESRHCISCLFRSSHVKKLKH